MKECDYCSTDIEEELFYLIVADIWLWRWESLLFILAM